MQYLQSAITTHVYAIGFFLLIMILNLYFVLSIKDFIKLAKRLRFMTPLYHLCNAIIIYSGLVIAFSLHLVDLRVILMIPTSIFLMIIEIKRYKKMRVIKSFAHEEQEKFYSFAKKVYSVESLVLIFMYFIIMAI